MTHSISTLNDSTNVQTQINPNFNQPSAFRLVTITSGKASDHTSANKDERDQTSHELVHEPDSCDMIFIASGGGLFIKDKNLPLHYIINLHLLFSVF